MRRPCVRHVAVIDDAGFTMAESLLVLLLTLVVIGAALGVLTPDVAIAGAQPDIADVQQRARVASTILFEHLLDAGAGPSAGPRVGPLHAFVAPVLARRLGRTGTSDAAVSDAVTIVSAVSPGAAAALAAPFAAGATDLAVLPGPECAGLPGLCGLVTGGAALVFDDDGTFDLFTVTSVTGSHLVVEAHRPDAHPAYGTEATVVPVSTRTYYFDADARQLRVSDGYLGDTPVVDDVVGLTFEYFADASPLAAPRPPDGVANCVYDESGAAVVGLVGLSPTAGRLAPLPLDALNDGPWCGAGTTRFDADALRIRRVRVTLRVQAALAWRRGAGPAYASAGSNPGDRRAIPDLELTFDVSPRNLGLADRSS